MREKKVKLHQIFLGVILLLVCPLMVISGLFLIHIGLGLIGNGLWLAFLVLLTIEDEKET